MTLPLIYVIFTDFGWSFESVPVNAVTVKGNLRNSGKKYTLDVVHGYVKLVPVEESS